MKNKFPFQEFRHESETHLLFRRHMRPCFLKLLA